MCSTRLIFMHHVGILSNRSIFGSLFTLKQNSCTYYVQYNTNPIGLLHCAIRDHGDYVILLFSKRNQELTLSHFLGQSLEQQSLLLAHMWDVTPTCERYWQKALASVGRRFDLLTCRGCIPEDHFVPSRGSALIKQAPLISDALQWPACCCPLVARLL